MHSVTQLFVGANKINLLGSEFLEHHENEPPMTYKTKDVLLSYTLDRKWKKCPLLVSSISTMLPAHMAILVKHHFSNGVLCLSVLKQTGP